MKSIFISYSSKEYDSAIKYRNAFIARGIDCWMAPESISVGSNYAIEIPKAIRGCKSVVFIMSENSQNSVWVQKEIGLAISCNKPVIPVAIDNYPVISPFDFFLTDVQIVTAADNPDDFVTMVCGMVDITSSESEAEKTTETRPKNASENTAPHWFCPSCGNKNPDSISGCSECGFARPVYWDCPVCGMKNLGNLSFCYKCSTPNPEKASWLCSECGTKNPDSSSTCLNCGAPNELAEISESQCWICSECNTENHGDNSLCFNCGAPRETEEYDSVSTVAFSNPVIAEAVPEATEYDNIDAVTAEETAETEEAPESIEYDPAVEWLCTKCRTLTPIFMNYCSKCHRPRTDVKTEAVETTTEPSNWTCRNCGSLNHKSVKVCYKCSAYKYAGKLHEYTSVSSSSQADEGENWFCVKCNTENPPRAAFCQECGEKSRVSAKAPSNWNCPKCGTFNSMHATSCMECGNKNI